MHKKSFIKQVLFSVAVAVFATQGYSTTYSGRYIVYACPGCGAKAHELELMSYNTCGAMYWSDCFHIAPMAPTQYFVARCWKCHKAFVRWKVESKVVEKDELGPKESNPYIEWTGDYAALKEVLDSPCAKADLDMRRDLLVQIAWTTNHKDRIATVKPEFAPELRKQLRIESVPEEEYRKDMLELSSMTNLPLAIRAEICREMKDFSAAEKLIAELKCKAKSEYAKCKEYVDEVEKRVKAKDSKVFKRW